MEAYKEIGEQVQSNNYEPAVGKGHTHEGSKDNLALDKIKEKKEKL